MVRGSKAMARGSSTHMISSRRIHEHNHLLATHKTASLTTSNLMVGVCLGERVTGSLSPSLSLSPPSSLHPPPLITGHAGGQQLPYGPDTSSYNVRSAYPPPPPAQDNYGQQLAAGYVKHSFDVHQIVEPSLSFPSVSLPLQPLSPLPHFSPPSYGRGAGQQQPHYGAGPGGYGQ